jgi:hypothetical protein
MEPTLFAGMIGDETTKSRRLAVATDGCSSCGARRAKIVEPTTTQTRAKAPKTRANRRVRRASRFGSAFSGSIERTDHPDPE